MIKGRWIALVTALGLTAGLGSLLPDVRVDNSNEQYLKGDDPERVRYDRFQAIFDTEDRVNVILEPEAVFELGFLEELRLLHREIEAAVPYVDEVTSLVNARNTRGEGDELIVEDLMENWPSSEADLQVLRDRALGNPLLVDYLITEDARYTLISIKPFTYTTRGEAEDALAGFDETDAGPPPKLSEEESRELVDALRQIAERHRRADLTIHVIGGPVMNYTLSLVLQRDVSLSLSLSLGLITGLLLLLFRRLSGVVIPIVVVVCAMISTMGLMVLVDIPFSITLNIVPTFLLVVGICDSLHILVIFYQGLARGLSRDEAIVDALSHSGLAVVMTSLTTAAGLSSFIAAEVLPVAQLGVIAPLGILLAMLYSLVLLPALLAVTPLRARAFGTSATQNRPFERALLWLGNIAIEHPRKVVAAAGIAVLLGASGVSRVYFSNDTMRWFPVDDPLRVAADLVDREFKGASSLEVLVYTGRENGIQEPDVLNRLENAMRRSETMSVGGYEVNKTTSLVDVVKEIHQALNENNPDYYVLPQNRQLIAQELLLFENSGTDDLEEITDSQFEMSRLSVRTPWVDSMLYPAFVQEVGEMLGEVLGDDLEFELTGEAVLFGQIFRGLILSLARSYTIAFLVITPMLVLLVGNLKRGLLAMIPNLIPVYMVLAFMGWLDIPLDLSTLLIGSIVLGVAVDDTIHFMHKFNRYLEDLGDAKAAVRATLATTGSALLFTSLILCMGFAVFMSSYLYNISWFGLLIGSAIVVAFFADILLAPALMVLAVGDREV